MDILAALQNVSPPVGAGRCKLQRIIDGIPDDTTGKAELVAALEPGGLAADRLATTFAILGSPVSGTLIRRHRVSQCQCFGVRS